MSCIRGVILFEACSGGFLAGCVHWVHEATIGNRDATLVKVEPSFPRGVDVEEGKLVVPRGNVSYSTSSL